MTTVLLCRKVLSLPHITGYSEIFMYVRKPLGWMFNVLMGLAEMPFVDETFLHWFHTIPNG